MMQSGYRLELPVIVSFGRDGHTREETIRYLNVRGPIQARNGDPFDGWAPNPPEKVEAFMAMLDDMEARGEAAHDREFLTYADLDGAVDDAFALARWRALDYIWGKNQLTDPAARCPRDFDAPSEAEAKARMVAAFGFDFSTPIEEEFLA